MILGRCELIIAVSLRFRLDSRFFFEKTSLFYYLKKMIDVRNMFFTESKLLTKRSSISNSRKRKYSIIPKYLQKLKVTATTFQSKENSQLENFPTEILFAIFDKLDLKSLGRTSRVCKSFYFFVQADIRHLYQKFVKKELWYICATKPEKNQYKNYRNALEDQIKLHFVLGGGSSPKLCVNIHPKMSMATLHFILCSFGYLPPYRTVLTLQRYDCSSSMLLIIDRNTSAKVINELVTDIKLFKDNICIKVESIIIR